MISTVQSLKLPDECGTCTIRNSSVALNDGYSWNLNLCKVIVIAPQSIELSALRNTFYSKKEIINIYTYIYMGREIVLSSYSVKEIPF